MKHLAKMPALSVLLFLAACTCHKDVTDDPAYKFSSIRDRLFVTKIALEVYDHPGERIISISVEGASNSRDIPTGILQSGTLIRPVQLTGENCDPSGKVVYVIIESGQYEGRKALLTTDSLFLTPMKSESPEQRVSVVQWEPNPLYLEPARR